jgi:hypothetical protein
MGGSGSERPVPGRLEGRRGPRCKSGEASLSALPLEIVAESVRFLEAGTGDVAQDHSLEPVEVEEPTVRGGGHRVEEGLPRVVPTHLRESPQRDRPAVAAPFLHLLRVLGQRQLASESSRLATLAWKWQRGDVSRNTGGDLAAALGRITAKVFVMPISTDLLFPVVDCAAEQALTPNSELRVIDTIAGHLGLFGVDGVAYTDQIDRNLRELLDTAVP